MEIEGGREGGIEGGRERGSDGDSKREGGEMEIVGERGRL